MIFWGSGEVLVHRGKDYRFVSRDLPLDLMSALDAASPLTDEEARGEPAVAEAEAAAAAATVMMAPAMATAAAGGVTESKGGEEEESAAAAAAPALAAATEAAPKLTVTEVAEL